MSELEAPCIEQEPSDTQGKPTEEATEVENNKRSLLDDEETKENLRSRQNIGDISETSFNNEASIELSKQLEEINPRSVEQLEGESARLADSEASIDISKSKGEHSSPKVPGLKEEEESTNLPRDIAEEVILVSHFSDPSINKKENVENLRSFEGIEGEPQFSTGQEIFVEPLKPASVTSLEGHDCSPGVLTKTETVVVSSQAIEDADNSNTRKEANESGTRIADQEIEDLLKPAEAIGTSETTKDVRGDPKDLTNQKAVLNTSKPAVDGENTLVALEAKDSAAVIIHNVNEPVASEFISNEKFDHVQDSKDESQRLDRQENIMETLKAVEVTNSESIRDIEGESKDLAEDEVNVTPLQLASEIDSSNDRDNTEETRKSIVHENVMDISKPSTGNDIVRDLEDNKGKSEDNDGQIHQSSKHNEL
ncbi:unnamed protein product [Dovyalis caffra]|uniref:Uncharacterized protein n=1 Tax=Dovyalis caffra TaxID=77055 RepID=A0AAV1RDM9_9ROSI|nr:unnamed protein product [Dovyalis caffra]